MRHSDVHADLGDYLEGDLPLDRRALVDAHLDGCPACAGRMRELRATVDALRSLGDAAPPPGFADVVMARIAAGEGRPSGFARFLQRMPPPLRGRVAPPLLALASAAVVVIWLRAPQEGPPGAAPTPVRPPTAESLAEAIRQGGPAGAPAESDDDAPAGPKVAAADLDAALGDPAAWLRATASMDPQERQALLAALAQQSGSSSRLRSLAQEVKRLGDPRAPAIAAELEALSPSGLPR